MAIIRRTMESIRRMKPRINRAKIAATTEADIRRHMSEDGEVEPEDLSGNLVVQLGLATEELKRIG